MAQRDKRTQDILNAARKAVSKIADPTLRARATAKLEASQKKIAAARRQTGPARPQRTRDRDLDFNR